MKLREPLKTVKALVGDNVRKSERCCGESGTFGVTPARHRDAGALPQGRGAAQGRGRAARAAARRRRAKGNLKILTSCPSCLQGLSALQGRPARTACSRPTTSSSRWRTASSARTGCRSTSRAPTTAASSACWCSFSHGRRLHPIGGGARLAWLHCGGLSTSSHERPHRHPPSDLDHRAPAIAGARGRLRRRRELPHPVRADAHLLAVGRGAGPRPGAGGPADRQARGRGRRRSSRSATTRCSRASPTATTPASSRGTTSTSSARSRTSCGRSTRSGSPRQASTATRRWRAAARRRRRSVRPLALTRRRSRQLADMSDTHFGFSSVDEQAQGRARARRLRFGRAEVRRHERPDVARPAPRLEGLRGRRRATCAPGDAVLDIAGGTGDLARAFAAAGRRARPRRPHRHQRSDAAPGPRPPARRRPRRCRRCSATPSRCRSRRHRSTSSASPSACAT